MPDLLKKGEDIASNLREAVIQAIETGASKKPALAKSLISSLKAARSKEINADEELIKFEKKRVYRSQERKAAKSHKVSTGSADLSTDEDWWTE